MGQVMWMSQGVHESDDDQDAGLGAQLRSPDYASQSSGEGRNSFLRRSRGASNRARDSASSTCLADAPCNSRDSSGLIGVALADEGEDKVPSPRQRHIISPEKLGDPSSDSPPVSDVSLTRRALILIPYFYNRP